MNKKLLFWSIEINVLLWILLLGTLVSENIEGTVRTITFVGFLFAAIIQHFAYHKFVKNTKDTQPNKSSLISKILLALLIIAIIFVLFNLKLYM